MLTSSVVCISSVILGNGADETDIKDRLRMIERCIRFGESSIHCAGRCESLDPPRCLQDFEPHDDRLNGTEGQSAVIELS